MDPDYARAYRELFERHWWWRAREALILPVLRSQAGDRRDHVILDVGCGDGLFFPVLEQFGEVYGVEADADLVSPDGPYSQRIHRGTLDDRFRPDRRFSVALMLDVLEHMATPGAALKRVAGLLADEGTLIITVPAFRCLWTGHDGINHHVTRYTKRTVRPLLAFAGLQAVTTRYFFHWCFPAKLVVRLKETVLRRPPVPARVPPAVVNGSLYAISRLEQAIFGSWPLPFGSSLLVVARRAAA